MTIPQATCPTSQQRDLAERDITASFNDFTFTVRSITNHPCGPGNWTRVAYVNMTDPSQQCPEPWVEVNLTGAGRTCSRPVIGVGNCLSVNYPTNGVDYDNVCGRSIGYQQGSPDALSQRPLDGFYVDGLSITHGIPRQHIWSFAAGLTEERCFCGDPSLSLGSPPPSFVENNYFCESGSAAVGLNVGLTETFPGDPL